MGLNDIRLSNSVLAALFPKSLIETDTAVTVNNNTPTVAESIIEAKQASTEKHTERIKMTEEPVVQAKAPAIQKWKHLGDNKKNILIVVRYPQFPYLPDEELNFLTAILAACQLTLGDVAIINHHHYTDTSYTEILKQYNSRTILLFGIEPAVLGLPVSFPEFQVQPFDSNKYLFAPTLQECRNDKLLKSKLWISLRSIFGIQ